MPIGERIKIARHAAGLSLRDLGKEVGVSAQAISKYERDLDMPSSGILIKIAAALGVRVDFLLRHTSIPEIKPIYRKRVSQSKKAEQAVISHIQDWLERYLIVEGFFPNDRMAEFAYPAGFPHPVATLDQVEAAADALRAAWNLADIPIENLTELLEDKGIKVGLIDGDDKFDACTFWANDVMPVIAIKRNLPGDRQRFNLAHELGHFMLEPQGDLSDEKAANRFAGAFLVPASAARYEVGNERSNLDEFELHLLKHKYGMSMQGWIYRAKDLEILSESTANEHFKRFRVKGWHLREPGDQVPFEQPERMTRLILRALAEELMTESRAAELLGQPLSHFLKQRSDQHAGFPIKLCS